MSNVPANPPFDAAGFVNSQIRTVPDWPQPGVQFRDITPLLQHPKALRVLVDLFVQRYIEAKLDYIAGLDARGFIIGPIVAYELNLGFIPIRKAGKLPYRTVSESYDLEYGAATVEMHEDACGSGDRIVIIDDLIATGGTMMAGKKLLERLGAVVVEGAAIIDLPDLGGSGRLRAAGLPLYTVTEFGGH
ncbi:MULTISPECIES: adenine phosphoribosyltransferase [Paraburkholderia]|uniref:Adenine phosphoribosyltransferase n=1 Tax=Paraburkholderia megapolitana TaxID=420953 RepID=A0A1I3G340_9BURK|nr:MULTISPECIES: adenine phosphoribosyltransferase [Paraburkholderia]MCX4160486.1 adenine phosphoribosyltransferase [Paraburkholderia megapolitana]MDN7155984.1 adenine phosphoribosyltransferase [Paraburkholderia sp. CHISQ3]MDQ6493028.1 adenine phosphoribosyltransferase [Paraburkholderia megapolitana]QDQ82688.1 adenine phosphoribosyltransferase [Paraburkholderia megapolitana]SFI17908.1 adenine phosphoribosyltransferase [Paraburkholderia megapolitana]